MKRRYNAICKAIYKSEDYRELIREWIMLIEKTRVDGWNRDEFLEEMCRVKSEEDKIQKLKRR